MRREHRSRKENGCVNDRFSKRIFRDAFSKVDLMLCSCGAQMKIVSVITDARVVDRILRHLGSERCKAAVVSSKEIPAARGS